MTSISIPAADAGPGLLDGSRQRWWALAALCLATLMVNIDNTIVNVALPSISRQLDAGTSSLQWIVDAYTLVFSGLLITGGHLGDRFGRRRILLVGTAGFAAISIPAALSPSVSMLIASRAGLGLFAALVFPATLAILVSIFSDAKERAAAFGLWSASAGVAVAIGPVLGGWLLEHFSWSAVFWVNLPIGAVVALAVFVTVPAGHKSATGPIDVLGLVMSVVAMSLLIYSVIEAPKFGWTDPRIIGGFVVAVVLGAVFVIRQYRSAHPIIDVRIFANRRFSSAAAMIALAFFSLFGFIFLITQYFQAVKGYGPLSAGLHTLPFAIVLALLSPVAMAVSQRIGVHVVSSLGALCMATGFAMVQLAGADASYWGLIVWSMSLMAAGLALIAGPCTQVVMVALPSAQAGAGSAVNDTTREFGGALGVAVLGSVLTSIYTPLIDKSPVLDRLPEFARSAAESSVVAGVEVARQVPAQFAPAVLDTVRSAFVSGLHHSIWVAVGACLASIPAVLWALRPGPTPDEAESPETTAELEAASDSGA